MNAHSKPDLAGMATRLALAIEDASVAHLTADEANAFRMRRDRPGTEETDSCSGIDAGEQMTEIGHLIDVMQSLLAYLPTENGFVARAQVDIIDARLELILDEADNGRSSGNLSYDARVAACDIRRMLFAIDEYLGLHPDAAQTLWTNIPRSLVMGRDPRPATAAIIATLTQRSAIRAVAGRA